MHCTECIIDVECFFHKADFVFFMSFSFQRFDISLRVNAVFFFVFSNKVDILFLKWIVDIFFSWIVVFFFVLKQLSWYFLSQMSWYSLSQMSSTMNYWTLRSLDIVNVKLTKKFNDRWSTSLSANNRIIIIVWEFWDRQK